MYATFTGTRSAACGKLFLLRNATVHFATRIASHKQRYGCQWSQEYMPKCCICGEKGCHS